MNTRFPVSVLRASSEEDTVAVPASVRDSIRQSLEGLRFGQVTINIHEGQVVQIDRIMKLRQYRAARSQ